MTGDMAARAANRYLRLVGRRSRDITKSGGFKIGGLEVEGALLDHPAISEAAVIGVLTPTWASGSPPGSYYGLGWRP